MFAQKMAVTYRVIERYSKRRFKTSTETPSSTSLFSTSKSTSVWSTLFSSSKSTSVWPAWSALSPASDGKNWALQYISFLFGLSAYCQIRTIIQKWVAPSVLCQLLYSALTNLTFKSCISYTLAPTVNLLEVVLQSVKRVIHRFLGWSNLSFAIRIDNKDHYASRAEANESSWSVMVYLIDIGNKSVFRTRQAIMDEIHAAPALKLLCQKKILGRLQIWRRCPDAEISCYLLVRELSPVWNHELVTPETVHDYVTDVIRQSDVAEPDSRRPPWRIHLIPLAFDPLAEEDCSTCCLVAQCHELLTSVVDNLIQRALKIHRMDFGSSLPTSHHYRVLTVSVERSIPSGSHAPAVSWTKAIPRTDFIDRVCSLAGTTIRELFIVSFSQSLNQCYNQSGLNESSGLIRIDADVADQSYSLPLGTPLLEDGHLVLGILKSQRPEANEEAITEPESCYLRRHQKRAIRTDDEPQVSVRMETVIANNELSAAGIEAIFRWTAPCTLPIPTIRLGLWIGNSSIRLGMIQRPHPALVRCPLRVGDIERRVYQLAASYGVQTGRPLSPHSTPTNTPGCTPPPTPRPR